MAIAPAPVLVELAAVSAPFPPPALPVAPAPLVAPETADVEAPEPQVLKRPYLPTQDIQFSDDSDDSSANDALVHARTLRRTPTYVNSGEQSLPAETIPTDQHTPLRPLSRSQSSHAISGACSKYSLNDSLINFSNAFEFEQGPLLEPQFLASMHRVDQGNPKVSQLDLVTMQIMTAHLIRIKIPFTSVFLVLLLHLNANRRKFLVQFGQIIMTVDRDDHLGIIMRKSFKTKYGLKRAVC